MKKFLFAAIALLALPAAAFATGIDLTWNDCAGASNQAADVVFDCSGTLDHVYNAVVQFRCPLTLDHCNSVTATLDIQSETPGPLAPFWHFERGGCQWPNAQGDPEGAVLLDDIRLLPYCSNNYADIWGGDGAAGTEGIAAYGVDYPRDGHGRFVLADFRLQGQPVAASVNYYAFHLRFTTQHRGDCSGCTNRVAMVLNSLVLGSSDGTPPLELSTANKTNCATINGATAETCTLAPTRNTTWGCLKALYR